MKQLKRILGSRRGGCGLLLGVLAMGVLVGCGPNKQMIRLQNEVVRLRRERAREVARLQREKFEAMQTQQVALERQQKRCRTEVKHLRARHRRLSFRVSRSARQIQRLLLRMMSDVLLMPMQDDPEDRPKKRKPEVQDNGVSMGGNVSTGQVGGEKTKSGAKVAPGGKDAKAPSPPPSREVTPKK